MLFLASPGTAHLVAQRFLPANGLSKAVRIELPHEFPEAGEAVRQLQVWVGFLNSELARNLALGGADSADALDFADNDEIACMPLTTFCSIQWVVG